MLSPRLSLAVAVAASAALCLACAGARPLPRTAEVSQVADAYAGSTQQVVQEPAPVCMVDSSKASVEMVAVFPPDAPAFALALKKVPMRAWPNGLIDAPVPVSVNGTLRFSGLAEIYGYALKKPQNLAGGLIHAGSGARLVRAAARGAMLTGTMDLSAGSLLVEGISAACSTLEVPGEDTPAYPVEGALWQVDGGGEAVTFWSEPGKGRKLSVWPGVSFHRVETRGSFTLLAVTMDDGSALHGWVDASKVTEGEAFGELAGGFGCGRGWGGSHDRVGKAIVRAGTKLSAIPGGAAWGDIPREAKMTIRYSYGNTRAEDVARIEEVDGFAEEEGDCAGPTEHMWLPASAVEFVKD
jgi:hypothetical protein